MQIEQTLFADIKIINNFYSKDSRGSFTKIFNEANYSEQGIDMEIKEVFYSYSDCNVIRGMHFQIPPYDHNKLVHVVSGAIIDVIVDLRKNSSNYGKSVGIPISSSDNKAIYVPSGFAHGFRTLVDNTCVLYMVSKEYSREHDCGIKWNSIGYDWECLDPIISDRDKSFSNLNDYISPF